MPVVIPETAVFGKPDSNANALQVLKGTEYKPAILVGGPVPAMVPLRTVASEVEAPHSVNVSERPERARDDGFSWGLHRRRSDRCVA